MPVLPQNPITKGLELRPGRGHRRGPPRRFSGHKKHEKRATPSPLGTPQHGEGWALCPGVPCPCPSLPPCTWQQGRAVAEAQLGQFTFMTPKSNKMRIGIDPQVLSRAIKHRFQQTGTAGEPAALGWVPGVCWGMCLWWRWGHPSTGCAGRVLGAVGSPELLTVSLCRGVWLCWAGWSCLPAPGTLLSWGGGIWGTLWLEGVHGGLKTAEWAHIAGRWPQVGGQVCTSGCGCAGGKLCRFGTHTQKHTHTHPPDGGSPCTGGHTPVQVRADPQWDKDRAAQQLPRGVVAHTTAQHTGMGA